MDISRVTADDFIRQMLEFPDCLLSNAHMKLAGAVKRPKQIEFFLRLCGLWERVIDIPPPPRPAASDNEHL